MARAASRGSYRTRCESCGRALGGRDPAFVCSFATTYCPACARKLGWVCGVCGGELARRPRRELKGAAPRSATSPSRADLSAIRVFRATLGDLDDVVPLFDAYRQFYGQKADRSGARRFLRDRLASGDSTIFLAWRDNEAVGMAQMYPTFSSTRLGTLWILNDLYVVPKVRRQRVGSILMARCEKLAADTGALGAWLETAVDNPAQHLYAGRGWTLDREFLHFDWDAPAPSPKPRRRGASRRAKARK
jgi:GNAT superfamily N-acetyltransferase